MDIIGRVCEMYKVVKVLKNRLPSFQILVILKPNKI